MQVHYPRCPRMDGVQDGKQALPHLSSNVCRGQPSAVQDRTGSPGTGPDPHDGDLYCRDGVVSAYGRRTVSGGIPSRPQGVLGGGRGVSQSGDQSHLAACHPALFTLPDYVL
jgi:hypothetical protein